MSNRKDDFDFGDDLFGDEDDLFGRRSEREDDSSMKFDDFADDADFENGIELPDDDVDFDNEEEGRERRGPNRAFIFIAVLFLIILLGGFAVLAVVILGGRGPSDIDITRTAIAQINSTTEALALATQAAATVQAELTQTALAFSPTPSITPSPTATSTPTIDAEATNQFIAGMTATAEENARSTAVAARNATATQIAINAGAQQTPGENGQGGGDDATPTPESGIPSLNAVQQTATALAELFSQQPTQVVVTPGPGVVPTQPTALPDSGLFDDLVGGNPTLLFLAAFGLLGVIFVTRRLRSGNRK